MIGASGCRTAQLLQPPLSTSFSRTGHLVLINKLESRGHGARSGHDARSQQFIKPVAARTQSYTILRDTLVMMAASSPARSFSTLKK
jgi:hypothetical protein